MMTLSYYVSYIYFSHQRWIDILRLPCNTHSCKFILISTSYSKSISKIVMKEMKKYNFRSSSQRDSNPHTNLKILFFIIIRSIFHSKRITILSETKSNGFQSSSREDANSHTDLKYNLFFSFLSSTWILSLWMKSHESKQ